MGDQDVGNEHLTATRPRYQQFAKVAVAMGIASALLFGSFALGRSQQPQVSTSNLGTPQQLNEILVTPPREKCAKIGTNCFAERCCKASGYTCYEKHAGYAQCLKTCTPGKDGDCLSRAVSKQSKKSNVSTTGTTLFCFAFYTENTGITKQSTELDLLRTQLFLGASIFGCESYRVYSDVSTWLSPKDVFTVKVDDTNNDFHFAKRKKTGTWINSNIFIATWKKIQEEGFWESKDWTVKVDADAVFLPQRLRKKLEQQEVTDNGIYIENCKYVNFGFFGNLEVFSHDAAATYIRNLDDCKAALNYMGQEANTGNEAWGEDLFAQRCMDLHGVDKVPVFDITTDAACAAWRPAGQKKNLKWRPNCALTTTPAIHPFKTSKEYFDCLKATQR